MDSLARLLAAMACQPGLSQQGLCRATGLTRQHVRRLLLQAQQRGVVVMEQVGREVHYSQKIGNIYASNREHAAAPIGNIDTEKGNIRNKEREHGAQQKGTSLSKIGNIATADREHVTAPASLEKPSLSRVPSAHVYARPEQDKYSTRSKTKGYDSEAMLDTLDRNIIKTPQDLESCTQTENKSVGALGETKADDLSASDVTAAPVDPRPAWQRVTGYVAGETLAQTVVRAWSSALDQPVPTGRQWAQYAKAAHGLAEMIEQGVLTIGDVFRCTAERLAERPNDRKAANLRAIAQDIAAWKASHPERRAARREYYPKPDKPPEGLRAPQGGVLLWDYLRGCWLTGTLQEPAQALEHSLRYAHPKPKHQAGFRYVLVDTSDGPRMDYVMEPQVRVDIDFADFWAGMPQVIVEQQDGGQSHE